MMFEHMTEQEARAQILREVEAYYREYHLNKKSYQPGDRIPYASRVYDEKEMTNLVDSSLDFWLTAGRYTEAFEKAFGKYL
ncbi:MAG: lipopolysaccharide biosynthesis protein RfbH, partial [Lachnospiraceae bacterium]|nr:lipopolysaccharide biosynthesis protein RfbH [Lachnospiraceae bacterium]